ncbi:unnamed protein product [Brassica oleracea var. botrytis]|uniref:(rape) hypothetical protein n=1 Tax=Brassica napus TaxID=3708 RepID=A0A816JRK1_BRANA|nr:unnamed protein product [Brassica napus]
MGIALPQFLLDIDGASGGILLLWIVGVRNYVILLSSLAPRYIINSYTYSLYEMFENLHCSAKAACELSLDPKNMKQEQAKVLEAASCHSEDGAVDTGPTLVLNGLQDILGQYSMVNLELFNIVEEVKKVSKAFVVLLVNAENAQSWDRVKKSCFTGRLVVLCITFCFIKNDHFSWTCIIVLFKLFLVSKQILVF